MSAQTPASDKSSFAEALLQAAERVRQQAYAPYSGFAVGAALWGENGRVYEGCNVESAAYPAGVCAERMALGAAVADGCRHPVMLAVVGGRAGEPADKPCMPCGVCRQLLAEFGELTIAVRGEDGRAVCLELSELLPGCFSGENLQA